MLPQRSVAGAVTTLLVVWASAAACREEAPFATSHLPRDLYKRQLNPCWAPLTCQDAMGQK